MISATRRASAVRGGPVTAGRMPESSVGYCKLGVGTGDCFSMLRSTLLRPRGSSTTPLLRSAQRHLLPLPAIAAAAVKFGGAALLKKVALSKVIQKLGPDKVVGELRALNGKLRTSGVRYGPEVADKAEESMVALEHSLAALRGDERIGAVWAWYSNLEKKNPTFAAVILKSWMETLPGMKWASALLSSSGTPAVSQGASSAAPAESQGASSSAAVGSDAHANSIINAIRESHPNVFEDYHVVLVPRDRAAESEARTEKT